MLSGVEYLCGLQRSSYQVTTRNGVNIGTQIIPGSAECLYLNKQQTCGEEGYGGRRHFCPHPRTDYYLMV